MLSKLLSLYRIVFMYSEGYFVHLPHEGKYYYRYYVDKTKLYWYDYDFTEESK